MNYKIVSDSSSNILSIPGANFASVPMKVRAGKEYIDDAQLNLAEMVEGLRNHKGTSGSSCPSVGEWLEAFGDADVVFCTPISKNLSGSYNSAMQAADTYMEENPGRKVYVLDSLAAGPQQAFLIDKMIQLAEAGLEPDAIAEQVRDYHNHTHILFCLESMNNLARNGRVNPAVAKLAGLLGIRACGSAPNGFITPEQKPRGQKKAMETLGQMMADRGLQDGNLVRIAHCYGEASANALVEDVKEQYPNCRFMIEPTTALCSFYAEAGGMIIGFEGNLNEKNDNRKF